MNSIDIKNLSFGFGNTLLFRNLNLKIEKGSFCTILGRSGVGKSTLFKLLSGFFKYSGSILILNKSIDYSLKKGYLGFVSPYIFNYRNKRVIDEVLEQLCMKGITYDTANKEVKRVFKKLGIIDILNMNINDLSVKYKVLLSFSIQFLNKPRVILIDGALDFLDNEKDLIVRELLRLNRKKITIINITNNTNDCLYGNEIIILGNKISRYEINSISEDVFLNNGLEPPFIISLSSKLKFYGLINDNYFSMEKLVDDLWQ